MHFTEPCKKTVSYKVGNGSCKVNERRRGKKKKEKKNGKDIKSA